MTSTETSEAGGGSGGTPTPQIKQQVEWMMTKTNIKVLIDGLTSANIKSTSLQLFRLNLFKAKGLLVRRIMKTQRSEPQKTQQLASLVSIVNFKLPEIGEILINKLVIQFKKHYVNNEYEKLLRVTRFVCELVNYKVVNEMLVLQIIQVLFDDFTDDSVAVVIYIIKLCGFLLAQTSSSVVYMVIDRLRSLVNEDVLSDANKRGVEQLIRYRRSGFNNSTNMLIEDEECHVVDFEAEFQSFDELMVFQYDPDYDQVQAAYNEFKQELAEEVEEPAPEEPQAPEAKDPVLDMTKSELLQSQKTVYLTIMSSMSSEEAVHKLLKLKFPEALLVDMVIKSCSQEKTYSKFFGMISEILVNKFSKYRREFETQFQTTYDSVHQLEPNAMRNVGKLFGHLIADGCLGFNILKNVILTQEHTTSASRILLKFIFQEIVEEVGIADLREKVQQHQHELPGMFPYEEPLDQLRFAINFFTAIGLGALTQEMRGVLQDREQDRGRKRGRTPSSRSSSYSRSPSPADGHVRGA